MMTSIDIDSDTIMRQAWGTADTYMTNAVADIDKKFGEGFAKKNPALIAAYMAAAASDFQATLIAQRVEFLATSIQDGMSGIASSITDLVN